MGINTFVLGNFNTPLVSIDRASKQKISKTTLAVNDMLDQTDFTGVYRAVHPEAAEYTSLGWACGTSSKIKC